VLRAEGLHGGPVAGLDLVLGEGLTVVTGEPECGTTTLLRLLAGTQQPDRGTVSGATTVLLEAPPGTEWAREDLVVGALGAPHLIGREMWAMSGGERQRARLANALASPAEVLLLDEPLGLLDAAGRDMVLDALHADGRPVLMACKSDLTALDVADQVLTMADGRLT
jgi:ABC-type cobalamin/Fe3+-siderophores transport system ATPase subunit